MKNKQNLSDLYEKSVHGTEAFPVAFYNSHHIITYQWHTEEEIIYMLEGEADYNVDGNIIHLAKGDCAFCQGKSLHSMLFDESSNIHFYAILFRKSFIMNDDDACCQYFNSQTRIQSFFSAKDNNCQEVLQCVKQLSDLMQKKKFGYELEVKLYLTFFYQLILKKKFYSIQEKPEHDKEANSIIPAIQFIHNNYTQKLLIDDLASASGYSTPYFERSFKAYTGKTPVEYILLFKLKQAQSMLRDSADSVLDICLLCGFTNESYFIRKYKEQYGLTPHQYRLLHTRSSNARKVAKL